MLNPVSPDAAHALEEAADELARLDTTCTVAPPCASEALRIAVIARLAGGAAVGAVRQLAALIADPLAEERAPGPLVAWELFVAEEERRVRGGAPLSVSRLRRVSALPAPLDGHDIDIAIAEANAMDAIFRESAGRRPALERAAELVARLSSVGGTSAEQTALAEIAAALVLCGSGRTDCVRLLPFAAAAPAERSAALAAWHAGEPERWRALAFATLARSARTLRRAVDQLRSGAPEIDARLDGLGRAAITARASVAVLRESFAITMPTLADRLSVSRPAAADALERLVALGIAAEVTGRRRDRVYAYEAALSVAESATAS